jgi:hypothetical protein
MSVLYYVLDHYKNATFTLLCSLPIKGSDGDVDTLAIHIPKERNYLTTIHFNRKLFVDKSP